MGDLNDINIDLYWGLAVTYGTKVGLFLLGLFVTWLAGKWVAAATRKAVQKARLDKALEGFLSKLAKWTVITMGVVSCLSIFGIQTASFAALLAGAGLAVGMALQGTLGNFASGVMLMIFRPFKIGDYVVVAGQAGTVTEIDIFNTILDTPDNRRVVVPNNSVFGNQIENVSYHSTRRVDVSVGTDYTADLDQTRKILLNVASSVENVLPDPEPAAVLVELGGSSIDWAVRVWTNTENYWAVKDDLTRAVKYALDRESIGIPYPQMDVHLSPDLEFLKK